ncbi:CGNR zinc finger domain-containing protein [Gloeobacter kilaueensis]|uniref:Zinc finger CGNR domain-containing protein n=1 Tax=Gloeobacter kilaueensis (strain ATCC BAA-2537 / CCAP 1431/1 / ULC 316 / JS1) TaxID=1183438 RepID=U5QMM0_GLOK1|nr:CGNR zinc finger domain-containing protein [Gloeobacter kilaueensis]AGY58900.1 hypothetical protein GKIL_2654 [Gloeobacter kilaueensis JS1]
MKSACLELLNSEEHDYRGSGLTTDRMNDRYWLPAFLKRWNLETDPSPGEEERAGLIALRSLLRAMVMQRAADAPLSAEQVKAFNALLLPVPLRYHLGEQGGGYRLELLPVVRDWQWVLSEIALSFAEVLVDPQRFRRLKVCENHDCRWVFYDRSKGCTRRWCEDSTCGNLLKVRRFRKRQAASRAEK